MFPFWKSRKQRQAEEAEWLEAERAAEREAAAWVPEIEVIDGETGRRIRYRHWLFRSADIEAVTLGDWDSVSVSTRSGATHKISVDHYTKQKKLLRALQDAWIGKCARENCGGGPVGWTPEKGALSATVVGGVE